MEKLRYYINSLSEHDRARLEVFCETTIGYLRSACSRNVLLGEKLCAKIDAFSCGAVSRQCLRPDDWSEIWPELVDSSFHQKEGSHVS